MKIKIYGPNLRDQSKGTFVVHAADCKDCAKLKGEEEYETDVRSRHEVVELLMPEDEFEDSFSVRLSEVYFAPCLNALPQESFKI